MLAQSPLNAWCPILPFPPGHESLFWGGIYSLCFSSLVAAGKDVGSGGGELSGHLEQDRLHESSLIPRLVTLQA